jgi:hypothetical protein
MITIAGRRDSYLEMLETAPNTCAYPLTKDALGREGMLYQVK